MMRARVCGNPLGKPETQTLSAIARVAAGIMVSMPTPTVRFSFQ